MIRQTRPHAALVRLGVIGACALALSGCVTLLPKSKPAQLYRFGQTPSAQAQAQPAPGAVAVFRGAGGFQRESAGDRLLTVTAGKAAYIADTRWVAPANVLFDEAVLSAFEAGRIRLVSRGEPGKTDYALRLDVRSFEADYSSGPHAPPTVVVRVRAILTRSQNSDIAGEQMFESRVPAPDNRVTAIVAAYDKALADVLSQVVAWTGRTAA